MRYQRIVIKIGSSSLTHNGGRLNFNRIDHFLRQMVDLKNEGREVLFVTSGSIITGMGEMGVHERPQQIPEQQALAAVGQAQLMAVYNRFLREYGAIGAQILLTAYDLEDPQHNFNAFNTMINLLKWGVIPIINENDTVATHEIKFGDNDMLSALVARLVGADLLIMLSDVEGLYRADPHLDDQSIKIDIVEEISTEIEAYAGGNTTSVGTGGMKTKVAAARIATCAGITTVVGPAYRNSVILEIVEMLENQTGGKIGTTFVAKPKQREKSTTGCSDL
ncbi:MAG: glutamate 5-kinase [Bacillota bacterium]|nr:glutamate 5-kinase [Bacillota bacterium]